MGIVRLNHAVLYVRHAPTSAQFYAEVLGFDIVSAMGDTAFFLRGSDSDNDHDLGLFEVGAAGAAGGPRPGLYHLAWQVRTIDELVMRKLGHQGVGGLGKELVAKMEATRESINPALRGKKLDEFIEQWIAENLDKKQRQIGRAHV